MLFPRWISVGSDLKFDARRDMDDVGATCVEGSYWESSVWSWLNAAYDLPIPFSVCLC